MSLKLFPFLATIGSLSGVSDVNPRPRVKRAVIKDDLAVVFSTFPQKTYKSFKKIYSKVECVPEELRSFGFDKVNSDVFKVPKNKQPQNTETDSNFSKDTQSCLAINWKKKTADVGDKWWGEWSLFWFVGNEHKADIFFNRVYTKRGDLYSEGISYKLEKESSEWKVKERFQSGERKVTENNKDNLIIKPTNDQVKNMKGDYGGFGDFDLDNVCSNSECGSLKNQEVGRKYWSFVSSETDSSSYSWFNYSDWRKADSGLFPSNWIGRYYWKKNYSSQRRTRSTGEIIPPSNSINRYSGLKGYFILKKGKVSSKYIDLKKKKK